MTVIFHVHRSFYSGLVVFWMMHMLNILWNGHLIICRLTFLNIKNKFNKEFLITSIPPYSTLVLKHHISSLCLKNKVFHQKLPHKCFYTLSIIGPLGRNHRIYFHFYVILSVSVCIFWGFFLNICCWGIWGKIFHLLLKVNFTIWTHYTDKIIRFMWISHGVFHLKFMWKYTCEILVKTTFHGKFKKDSHRNFHVKFSFTIQFMWKCSRDFHMLCFCLCKWKIIFGTVNLQRLVSCLIICMLTVLW